ncbi:MAG TPA: UDP-N-acetylglucosamine--N-acetylmuramyl-(pentapeptide) pyrophosphoryl-undecaprenol N-acetylglucosamine transferase [Patescibacteria group bacterium]|nr:UDP-N-acetylglucosamine--N-acetylmuramyl-(pentapeptide) pyrophosphoryl-undecaprenol N-acetylglucosamine transferase [Patescibacteria group bacterium]
MKICLIGGHLGPALALLDYVPSHWQVVFLGRQNVFEGDPGLSLEYQAITKRDIPFYPLTTGRLQRKLTKRTLLSLPKVPVGYLQALRYLRKEKPDVVFGFGGYVSLSVGLAAKTLGIPVVIHEQTLRAGLANRFLGRFAEKIYISWESSRKYFPANKTIVTGNLLRKTIIDSLSASKNKKAIGTDPVLYITGGSAGSHSINVIVEEIIERLLGKYTVIHQTGDALEFGDYTRLIKRRELLPLVLRKKYTIMKFIEPSDVGEIYRNADLVISRSGVNTMTELLVMKKSCLLIPLPHGQRDEQIENAAYLKEKGLATVLLQKDATGESLLATIDNIMSHITDFSLNAPVDTSIHLHAAFHVVDLLGSLYEKKEDKKP